MNSKQHVRAGDESVTVQIGTLEQHYGLSYSDVRAMLLDLFKENFPKLQQEAMAAVMGRVEEITEEFLNRFVAAHPEALGNARDPDFQMALLQVQREYARSGDKELGDLLVDMLVDRSSQTGRSIRQLTLNEALNTAPRITHEGVTCLTVLWLVKRVLHGVATAQELHEALRDNLARFVDGLGVTETELRHLEYAGCVSIGMGQIDIIDALSQTYHSLFTNGFDSNQSYFDKCKSLGILMPCLRNSQRWQINIVNPQLLDDFASRHGIEGNEKRLLDGLFNSGGMSRQDVEDELRQAIPELGLIIDAWRNSLLKHSEITNVGVAIAHANWRRVTGNKDDVAIWLV